MKTMLAVLTVLMLAGGVATAGPKTPIEAARMAVDRQQAKRQAKATRVTKLKPLVGAVPGTATRIEPPADRPPTALRRLASWLGFAP